MFQAFIDDSNSDIRDKKIFLCAYVNSATEWIKFADDWALTLKADPPINFLHMVEAGNLRGEFKGWNREKRDNKIVDLAKVIDRYKPIAIDISLSRNDFEELIKPVAPYFLQSPYFCCFYGMILGVARVHKQLGVSAPVDFVFDETTASKETVLWYDYVKSQNPHLSHLLGSSPQFKDDKNVLPLQAADMLAWHVRRRSEGRPEHLPALPYLFNVGATQEMTRPELMLLADKFKTVKNPRLHRKKEWKKLRPLIAHQLSTGSWPGARDGFLKRALKRLAAFIRAKLSRSLNKPQ